MLSTSIIFWTGGDSTLSLAHGLPADKQRAARSGFPAQDLLGRSSAMVRIPQGFVPPAFCPAPTTASCAVTPQGLFPQITTCAVACTVFWLLPAAEQMDGESLDLLLVAATVPRNS